jgi:predicted transcriptional regulator
MDARLTFRLDEQLAADLERLARRNERSTGAKARRAVKAHLAREDDDPPSRAGRVTTSADTGDGRVEAYAS